jgi:hypothetical protein
VRNFFKILARGESVKTDNLESVLSIFGCVEVVSDIKGDLEGYTGMGGYLPSEESLPNKSRKDLGATWNSNTTAWDLLFKDLTGEYTWVIEDDVAFNQGTIKNILNEFKNNESDLISNEIYSKHKHPNWDWWHLNDSIKETELWHSLNCFCRISPNLIKKIKQHRDRHGKFTFHEMLLPSLAETRTDFRRSHFGSYFNNFSWKPSRIDLNTVVGDKVYHPVKSDDKHLEICNYK